MKKQIAQSYYENTAVEINAANIILGGYDNDEKAQEILVKKDTDTTEKFYVANPDLIYIHSDGCKFYFQRDQRLLIYLNQLFQVLFGGIEF